AQTERRPEDSCGKKQKSRKAAVHFCAAGGVYTAFGNVFIFCMNSGYMVSAPPSVAASGKLWVAAYSATYGFSPGRKCGTWPRGCSPSSIASQGQKGTKLFGLGTRLNSSLLMSGSSRYMGSSVTLMCVNKSPCLT